jgi:hypothetical protein
VEVDPIGANIKYYEELLRTSPEDPQRKTIEMLLVKERAK